MSCDSCNVEGSDKVQDVVLSASGVAVATAPVPVTSPVMEDEGEAVSGEVLSEPHSAAGRLAFVVL
jgi:hypothetical protein